MSVIDPNSHISVFATEAEPNSVTVAHSRSIANSRTSGNSWAELTRGQATQTEANSFQSTRHPG